MEPPHASLSFTLTLSQAKLLFWGGDNFLQTSSSCREPHSPWPRLQTTPRREPSKGHLLPRGPLPGQELLPRGHLPRTWSCGLQATESSVWQRRGSRCILRLLCALADGCPRPLGKCAEPGKMLCTPLPSPPGGQRGLPGAKHSLSFTGTRASESLRGPPIPGVAGGGGRPRRSFPGGQQFP